MSRSRSIMAAPAGCLLTSLAVLTAPSPAPAQVLLSAGHVDFFDIGYESTPPTNPSFGISIHDEETDTEYATTGNPGATDWAKLVVNNRAIFPRPAGAFDPIGVPAGTDFWWLKSPQNPETLFGGASAEEVPTNPHTVVSYTETDPRVNLTGRWIKLQLLAKTGPGDVSVWSESGGTPTFWFTTSDGISAVDSLFVLEGGHTDYNFGFTQPGEYTLTVRASAFPETGPGTGGPGTPLISEDTVISFIVQPVPEPSSLMLLGAATVAVPLLRRIRRARRTIH